MPVPPSIRPRFLFRPAPDVASGHAAAFYFEPVDRGLLRFTLPFFKSLRWNVGGKMLHLKVAAERLGGTFHEQALSKKGNDTYLNVGQVSII